MTLLLLRGLQCAIEHQTLHAFATAMGFRWGIQPHHRDRRMDGKCLVNARMMLTSKQC